LAKYLGEGTSRKEAEEKSSAFLFFAAPAFLQRLTQFGDPHPIDLPRIGTSVLMPPYLKSPTQKPYDDLLREMLLQRG